MGHFIGRGPPTMKVENHCSCHYTIKSQFAWCTKTITPTSFYFLFIHISICNLVFNCTNSSM